MKTHEVPLPLICLAEESAEVIQEVMKAERFGLDCKIPAGRRSKYPVDSTPKSRLEEEIGDWLGTLAYAKLSKSTNLDFDRIIDCSDKKLEKLISIHGEPA